MTEGFLFVATGARFVEEASVSARRIRELMPTAQIALASDLEPAPGLFDHVIRLTEPTHTFADKVAPLQKSPFERTVFLDTDTWLCEPVPELFSLLERWDIAMAHAPMRKTGASSVPPVLPEFNSGVIVFRRSEPTSRLLQRWQELYAERLAATGVRDDQPSLRDALWEVPADVLVLPPEYNFRFVMPAFAGRGPVKILHGRSADFPALQAEINGSTSVRVFLPGLGEARGKSLRILGFYGRMLRPWLELDAVCVRAIEAIRLRWKRLRGK